MSAWRSRWRGDGDVDLEARGGELGGAAFGGLEAQIERLAIEAEEHGGDERRVGHRRAARHAIAAGALPVVEAVAADLRADEAPRRSDRGFGDGARHMRRHRLVELARRRQAERAVGAGEVRAEERVEERVLHGVERLAEPPEPVAALGGEEMLEAPRSRCSGVAPSATARSKRRARAAEQLPGAVLDGIADPDVEGRVDPRARVQLRQARAAPAPRRGGRRSTRCASSGSDDSAGEQRAQERLAEARVRLPRVLAVEEDGHQRRLARRRRRRRGRVARARQQIGHAGLRVAVRVGEADLVGELAIAEHQVDAAVAPRRDRDRRARAPRPRAPASATGCPRRWRASRRRRARRPRPPRATPSPRAATCRAAWRRTRARAHRRRGRSARRRRRDRRTAAAAWRAASSAARARCRRGAARSGDRTATPTARPARARRARDRAAAPARRPAAVARRRAPDPRA